ncbi:MAG: hypothetical protein KIT17_03490 [Rubrivivax sp.]|nr:hypothetical protein [Rubrivivax sp.]
MIPVACCASDARVALPLSAVPAAPVLPAPPRARAASVGRTPASLRQPQLPARAIRLAPPLAARLADAVAGAWRQWREAARERAELRALAALDPLTLRDIGMAERAPRLERPSWVDLERARW